MNTIYFVRHGENPANLTREFSHHRDDYGLTPVGIRQAQETATYFRDQGIDSIYTSPLKRARETAEIIAKALGLPIIEMETFREVNTGRLEDEPPTAANWAFHDGILHDWMHGKPETRFPGGEDYFTLIERVRAGIADIIRAKSGGRSIVVAHGGILATALRELCPGTDLSRLDMRIGNCAITRFEFALVDGAVQGRLRNWASCAHLSSASTGPVAGVVAPGDGAAR